MGGVKLKGQLYLLRTAQTRQHRFGIYFHGSPKKETLIWCWFGTWPNKMKRWTSYRTLGSLPAASTSSICKKINRYMNSPASTLKSLDAVSIKLLDPSLKML